MTHTLKNQEKTQAIINDRKPMKTHAHMTYENKQIWQEKQKIYTKNNTILET